MTTKTLEKKITALETRLQQIESLLQYHPLSSILKEESFNDYKSQRILHVSVKKGLKDWQTGRVHTDL